MRVVFIAAGPFALPTLESLTRAAVEIPLVITQPDRRSGRGRRLTPTPVHQAATRRGLTVVPAADVNTPDIVQRVAACQADVGVVIDFGQKVGAVLREAIRGGCVNLHASLLPELRGAAPYQWAILRGRSLTGVTVFRLVDRMDAGPVLAAARTEIGVAETADELHDRLARMGPDVVAEALALFHGGRVPGGEPQDDRLATTAPKLKKQDGRLDFAQPADAIVRRILGLWSWPGARCRFVAADGSRDEPVTIARARVSDRSATASDPGTLDNARHAAAADGALEILEIKPQAGKLMSWQAYVNGRHVRPGDRFAPLT